MDVVDDFADVAHDERSTAPRFLDCFGITTSQPAFCDNVEFSINIELGADQIAEARFDPETKRWRLIAPSPIFAENGGEKELHTSRSRSYLYDVSRPAKPTDPFSEQDDWTKQLPSTEHIKFVLSIDWARTPLGPIRAWPPVLRAMTHKMLADPRPACLYWGETRIAIYNEPFVEIAFSRHPGMMGASAENAMPATWPFLSQMFHEIERSGNAFSAHDFEMEVHKESGVLEEAWYDAIFSPIKGPDGSIVGFYNSGFEITRLKILDRRSKLLHRIHSTPNFHITSPWQHILESCRPFERDISMLVLYSAEPGDTLQAERYSLRLEGSLAIPEGHQAVPERLEIQAGNQGFLPTLRLCKLQGAPILLDMKDGRSPEFLDGLKWRGFGEPAPKVVITPLYVTGLIAGFVILGLNSRLPYDEDHKQFVEDFGRVCTAALSSSVSFEQARAREAVLARELTERERFIRSMAEVATVGIYSSSSSGEITYANSKFHDIVGTSVNLAERQSHRFAENILQEDQQKAIDAFDRCRTTGTPASINLRLNRRWTPPGFPTEEYCWILNSIAPSMGDNNVTSVVGCVADISHTMWALQLQKMAVKAAEEAKRQHERFIDITSHEMRNPLSAMMQCADGIASAVEARRNSNNSDETTELLQIVHDNAQTILLCTSFQKRIIDDILTVSKLDSALLTFTPVLANPALVVQDVMQMFSAQIAASETTMSFNIEPSCNTTWAHFDPARLTQILVNLLTNSIKFTKLATTREVHVTFGSASAAPPPTMSDLRWYPKRTKPVEQVCESDEVFLTFTVRDTGKGMSEEEMSRLFDRFRQASPMTHVQYGGSGLGLFISRELAELQGGMIGVTSKQAEGSTFGLFIKAKKATASEARDPRPHLHPRITSHSGRQSPVVFPVTTSSTPKSLDLEPHDSKVLNPNLVNSKLLYQNSHHSKPTYSILLVEDNVINQKVLTAQLQRLGCRVHIANHGLEAIDFVQKTRFWRANCGVGLDLTVVLMDWEMPICDGLTCTRRLRDMERQGLLTDSLKIIAITSNARQEQIDMALAAGMDKFLAKPFVVTQVIKMIESL